MAFKELLKEKLSKGVELDLDKLPSGFQRLENVIVLNLDSCFENYKKEIGEAVLEIFPTAKCVCNKFGEIKGKFREPQIEVIAGNEETIVTHIEHGIKYKFDLRKVMFAKGNLSERVRYPKLIKEGEIIVDMFAGLGYFSLAMGKLSGAKKIYSIELNPVSFGFFIENIKLNKIDCIEAINGDNRKVIDELVSRGVKADRVLMGYLPPPKEFLPWAFKIIKRGGIIHYETILSVREIDDERDKVMRMVSEVAKDFGYKVELENLQDVKSYGPGMRHVVFDLKIL